MTASRNVLSRSERRALLRRHHPDAGGDPDEFVRVLAATTGPDSDSRGTTPITTTGFTDRLGGGRWRAWSRRTIARIQVSLPRRLPGARRYGHL